MPRVYLIDERIGTARLTMESIPKGDLGFLIHPSLSVTEIVSKVLDGMSLAAKGQPATSQGTHDEPESFLISDLRVLAYGSGDELFLGWGVNPRNAAQLAPLSPYLRTGASGRCLLFGCNVAMDARRAERFLGGSSIGQRFGSPYHGRQPDEIGIEHVPGYALLRALARTLQVPTTAALESQSAATDWQFMGSTVTVDPFGQATFAGMDTPVSLQL